ncbi:MAG: cytochrome c3 family protein [Pseudomonadota bacterium]
MACDQCHNTTSFGSAKMNHGMVAPGTCSTCHNGVYAKGKPRSHPSTSASCDQCHSTRTFDK